MEFKSEAIGSRILETLTNGLYDGNINCLREYIQNSIDSGAENVGVYFENGNNDLVIKDDGRGMVEAELKKALYLGVSEKGEGQVGWRGIGIWSGVSSCERIVIITKKKNNKKLRIVIDCKVLRDEYLSDKPVIDILTAATEDIEEQSLGKGESLKKDQFTIVRLESILKPQKRFFEDEEIEDYLCRVIPIPFDKKSFPHVNEIEKWLKEKNVKFREVKVKFKGKQIFRPPYRTDIFHNYVIKEEFKLGGKLIAVGWFLSSYENKKLQKPNAGIYFKKLGFTIGDENLVTRQAEKTYSEWQYGEIHVTSTDIRENAARHSFEYNDLLLDSFFEQVGEFLMSLQGVNRYQSNTTVDDPTTSVEKLIEKGDLSGAKKKVETAKKRVNKSASFPTKKSLKGLQPLINTKSAEQKKDIAKIESKIKKEAPSIKKKLELKMLVDSLSPSVKESIGRMTKKGLKHPEISATDSLRDLLKEKTGLKENEIIKLSKAAFGWNKVTKGTDPLITIDPLMGKDEKFHERRAFRNRNLGVMVYAIHDLFVNPDKHETGKESFKWFDDLEDDKKDELIAELYITVDLLYRLIEKTEKYQPQLKDLDIS